MTKTSQLSLRFFAAAIAFSAVFSCLWGQVPSLSGSVKDPQGLAVPGTLLTLFPRNGGAASAVSSDGAGAYRFPALPAGSYLLRAEAPGFAPYVAEDIALPASAARDVALQLTGLRQQVVVTASGTAQAADEISKSITTVDGAEAAQRDVSSLADAVQLAPGVHVQQLGGPGSLTAIRIRGMRTQDTAVLVDGLRLRDAAGIQGDAMSLTQDLLFTDSSRIEVMNGAGSSLYGSNAIGGVVNIVTDQGGGRTRGSVLAEGGSIGTARVRAQVAGSLAQDRLQYSAGLAHVNVSNGVDGNDAFRDSSAQGHLGYRLTNTTLLTARLYAGDSFARLNGSPEQTGTLPGSGIVAAVPFVTFVPGADDPDSSRTGRFLSGTLGLSGQPTVKLNYSLNYQILASGRRYNEGPAGPGFQPFGAQRTVSNGRVQTANAQLNYRWREGQLLTGGYEFETENYANAFADRSDPAASSRVNVSQKSSAFFIQDQARLFAGRLQLSGAFRAQYFSLSTPLFTPSAAAPFQGGSFAAPPAAYTGDGSAAYFFRRTGTKLRAHVGRGYRAPSLFERFGTGFDSFFGYSVYGDPRLQPEHSVAFDAGIEQSFGGGRASATYFHTRLQQVISFATLTGADPFGRFFGYLNSQGGVSRGVELSGSFSPVRAVDVSAAYTFVDAQEPVPLVGDVLRTFVIPRQQVSAAVHWRATKRILLNLDTLMSGNYLAPIFAFPTTRVYRFEGARRVNAGAGYRLPLGEFKAVRFFVRGENLGGQDYFENGYRTPGRTARGGIQFEF